MPMKARRVAPVTQLPLCNSLIRRRSHFVYSIRQMEDLCVELVYKRLEFLHRVEHLDAAGVRVESHFERPRHGRHPAPELILHVVEALRHVVDRLVLLVLVGLDGRHRRFEGSQLRLIAQSVEQLPVGAQQAGAVGFHNTAFLAQTELDSEPINLQNDPS